MSDHLYEYEVCEGVIGECAVCVCVCVCKCGREGLVTEFLSLNVEGRRLTEGRQIKVKDSFHVNWGS